MTEFPLPHEEREHILRALTPFPLGEKPPERGIYMLTLVIFTVIGLLLGGFCTYYLFPREIVTIYERPVPIDLKEAPFLRR